MTLYKYPRTPHLPWSPGTTNDDRILSSTDHFAVKNIVVSLKMDGENTTLYKDTLHARSMDSKDHESRHWMKAYHAQTRHYIPIGWRICGENLFAKHSIKYIELPSYFLVFSVWTDKNKCLSWEDTVEFCKDRFDLVPVFHKGIFDVNIEQVLKFKFVGTGEVKFRYPYADEHEGYVIRLSEEFDYKSFDTSVAKYVRKNHVQTDKHWMFQKVERNELL